MKITEYREADLPAMLEIWNEVVRAGQAFPQEWEERNGDFFAGQSYCGVARLDNGEIAGLYILHPNNVDRCSHLCNASYAVAKNLRGQGIGRKLVEDSLMKAKALGFRVMQFNAVTADNDSANELYKSLGFEQLGTIPGGFRRPAGDLVDINLYYKPL